MGTPFFVLRAPRSELLYSLSWRCSLVFGLFLQGPRTASGGLPLNLACRCTHPFSCPKSMLTVNQTREAHSKLGRSLVSWLASNFSSFPTRVLAALNPQLNAPGPPTKRAAGAFF